MIDQETTTETPDSPALGLTVPESKREQSRRLARDCAEFFARGGTKTTDKDEVSDDAEMTSVEAAQYLGTNGTAVSTGIRRGRLFGADFPAPKHYRDGKIPVFRTKDIIEFSRRAQE